MTIDSAVVCLIPSFVKAADVAHALGVTRECVYANVRTGRLPFYEFSTPHTRGWSRTTLLNVRPDLWQIMCDYFADKKAAATPKVEG